VTAVPGDEFRFGLPRPVDVFLLFGSLSLSRKVVNKPSARLPALVQTY
jgi:hypothetical protein